MVNSNASLFISYAEEDFEKVNSLLKYLTEGKGNDPEINFGEIFNSVLKNEKPKVRYKPAVSVQPDRIYSYAHQSSVPGTHFPSILRKKIDNSKLFILIWSRNSVASSWVEFEIEYALTRNKIVVPVIFDKDLKLPGRLQERQAIMAYENINWMYDISKGILHLDFLFVDSQLELDKKSGKKMSFPEWLKYEYQNQVKQLNDVSEYLRGIFGNKK